MQNFISAVLFFLLLLLLLLLIIIIIIIIITPMTLCGGRIAVHLSSSHYVSREVLSHFIIRSHLFNVRPQPIFYDLKSYLDHRNIDFVEGIRRPRYAQRYIPPIVQFNMEIYPADRLNFHSYSLSLSLFVSLSLLIFSLVRTTNKAVLLVQ